MAISGDLQRLFLQAVLSRGILSGALAQILWKKCIDAIRAVGGQEIAAQATDQGAWEAFVVKINASLNDLDLEFRHLHDESNGNEVYALVNRRGDEIAQMATDYTPAEVMYFKAIVEQIMLAPNESFSVSSLAALREVSAIRPKLNLSKTQAEIVLGSFVAKGWLLKSKRGRYCLSTRSLLELQPYLKSTYPNEIIECTICLEIVTRGVACHTNNCKTRLHYHCFTVFRRRHTGCPTCNADWPAGAKDNPLIPIGELAARDGDDRARRTRGRNTETSEEGEEEEEEEEEEEQSDDNDAAPSQTQASQPSQRGKAERGRGDEAMDIEGSSNRKVKFEKAPLRRSGRR